MRKRGTGPLVILTVIIALGTLVQDYRFDMSLAAERAAAREVDRRFGAMATNLAELRAAQAGYVAVGQSTDYWMTRVTEVLSSLEAGITAGAESTTDLAAKTHYENAAGILGDIRRLDGRARDNARRDEKFVASDQIFMDGVEANRRLGEELDQARAVEAADAEARIARLSWLRLATNGLALGFALVVMLFYARAARAAAADAEETAAAADAPAAAPPAEPIPVGTVGPPPAVTTPPPPPVTAAVNLSEAAELCVDLARVMDTRDVPALLGRAARVMDAKGVVLWIADEDAGLLRPSLAHGYDSRAIARMGPVPVQGESVTSAAFRTMKPQTVHSPTPKGNGAIAVPLITADGCAGVLAAEIRQSKPSAERIAIARVIAAQFSVLVSPAADADAAAADTAPNQPGEDVPTPKVAEG